MSSWAALSNDACAKDITERTPIEQESCMSTELKPWKIVAVLVTVAVLSSGMISGYAENENSKADNLTPLQKREKKEMRDKYIKIGLIGAAVAAGVGFGGIKIAQRVMRREYVIAIDQKERDLLNPLAASQRNQAKQTRATESLASTQRLATLNQIFNR